VTVMMVSIFIFCRHSSWLLSYLDSRTVKKELWIRTGCWKIFWKLLI